MNFPDSEPRPPDPGPSSLDDLDTLLQRTVSVEPSPAFLPRVRDRVASETPRWSWSGRMFAAGGAAAAAILIAVSMARTDDPSPRAVPQAPVIQATAPIPPAVEPEAERDVERVLARRPSRVARATGRPRVADTPPVIVDERQRAALNAVIQMAGRGELTDEAFAQTVPPSLQPIEEQVTGIAVAPLVVSPMVVGGVLQVGPEQKQPPRPAEAGISRP